MTPLHRTFKTILAPRALFAATCIALMVVGAVALADQMVTSFDRHAVSMTRIDRAHEGLSQSVAQLSRDNPSTQSLTTIAAQARWIEAQLKAMSVADAHEIAPRAAAIAASADRLLLLQVGAERPGLMASRLVAGMRRAEGVLTAELSDLERRLERTHWWQVVLLAGGLLVALAGAAATFWLRRNLTGPIRELAQVLETDGGASTQRRRVLPWQRYREALQTARSLINAPLAVRHQILDTLPAHIALLDAEGKVIHVNTRWRQFAAQHATDLQRVDVGANYLSACEASDEPEPRELGQDLRAIVAGERSQLEFEYPCTTPDGKRWFRMVACSVAGSTQAPSDAVAVVMHLDITEQKQAEEQLIRIAYRDQLTNLPSRSAFVERLERELPELDTDTDAARYVLVLDVQELRAVNDTYGYETGDTLLVTMGARLADALAPHEHMARLGGDQFAIYLDPRAHSLHDGALEERIAAWVDERVAQSFDEFGYRIDIGVWTGMTRVRHDVAAADLVRRAALATHMARRRPIARALVYDRELDEKVRERADTTRALHRAVEREEFTLDYQPNVHLHDGAIVSAEALIRWDDPERGRQWPASFIPIAEKSRLIVPIGEWTIRAACLQLRRWQDRGFDTGIAINISRVHFAHADVAACVADAIAETAIEPSRLTIEVTESAFEHHTDHLLDQLDRLHYHGVRLALDDFGTGYSSLKYLQQSPFDVIKVDMRFTQHVGDDRYSHDVVRMVQMLANSLGAQVVAEGIETAAQHSELGKLGCIFGQGHYFARPMTAETLEESLARHAHLPNLGERTDNDIASPPSNYA